MKFTSYILLFSLVFVCSCQNHNNHSIEDFTITNLYDAFGEEKKGLIKDFGFSALVKYKGKLILFDSGTNADILEKNVKAIGIDLKQIDFAVGSHAHGDHLNGFDYLIEINPDVKIYLPFDFYIGANINFNVEGKEKEAINSLPPKMKYFGGEKNMNLKINQSGRFWNANVEYIKGNKELEPGINLIFTKSPFLGYASKYPSVENKNDLHSPNSNIKFSGLPEISLSLSTDHGEILVVGCSHSSVQNIVIETNKYTNNKVNLLYGGYHLLPYDRSEINHIASQLKNDLKVEKLAPTHCTGHLAFKILQDIYGNNYLFAGLGETIKFN